MAAWYREWVRIRKSLGELIGTANGSTFCLSMVDFSSSNATHCALHIDIEASYRRDFNILDIVGTTGP